jgi:hypothetical protein
LLAGFLAEILVIALVIPVSLLFGKNALTYAAPAASLLACFLFAIWVGRRLDSRFVLHGVLVGIVAARRQNPTGPLQTPAGEVGRS